MSNDSQPSTYDQQIMLSGFTGSGEFRSALVTGQSSAKKVKQLTERALQLYGATQLPFVPTWTAVRPLLHMVVLPIARS